jgi:D-alanine-D-alanine ligase
LLALYLYNINNKDLPMKKNLALVAGGYSGEYAISVESAKTIEQNIDANLYNVYKIIITKDSWYFTTTDGNIIEVNKDNFTITIDEQTIFFDVVFIGIHGTPGEDGKLQGYFDMLEIPYTGCKSIVSALTFNKIFCNRVVDSADVVGVAKSLHMFKDRPLSTDEILNKMRLPLFVKPCEGGSSLGTNKVKEPAQMQEALDAAFVVDDQIMAEEFVGGREATIGVYKLNGQVNTLPITEVVSENEFFDYEAKYQGKSKEITPAVLPDGVEYAIKDTAVRIYNLLNCDGVIRVDFIIENNTNRLFFLEVNTMPGQSAESIIPQQVRAAGMNLTHFYGQLIAEALR